jgi:hypothetical protein
MRSYCQGTGALVTGMGTHFGSYESQDLQTIITPCISDVSLNDEYSDYWYVILILIDYTSVVIITLTPTKELKIALPSYYSLYTSPTVTNS